MTLKIIFRWLLFVVAPFVIGITIYRTFVGPTSQYLQLATPFIFLMIVPVSYLTQDWKYIQTTRYGGRFGDIDAPINHIVSIPDSRIDDIDINRFDHRLAHLNRWAIFSKADQPFTFFYDRLTKKWYYHYYNQKSEELIAALRKSRPI